MNFNNNGNSNIGGSVPTYGGSRNGQLQYPPQQNQQQPRNNIPLPPQLANLTPEQLQHLRQQPQFHQIIKNYFQRQQQALVPGLVGASPNMTPQQLQQQQLQQQQLQHRQALLLQTGATPQVNPQLASRQLKPGLQQLTPEQQALAAHVNLRNSHRQQDFPHSGRPDAINGLANGSRIDPLANNIPVHKFTRHAPVPEEIMRKVRLDPLTSANQWSEKLEKEGKEVPVELKMYESVVANELKYKSKHARHLESNKKFTMDLLHDTRSYNEIKQLRMNAIAVSLKGHFNNSIWGEGYQGYGNDVTNQPTQLILPPERKQGGKLPENGKGEKRTNKELINRLLRDPKRRIVPIRLDFSDDRLKLRDTFLWDLNEQGISVEEFVTILLDDYKFIDRSNLPTILKSVKDQIEDYSQIPAKPLGELRVPIKINITLNNTQYTDQFEWDILNFEDNDPEEFSVMLADEMHLPGEFATAISHSIREQTQIFHKSLILTGYSFDGAPVNEDEIRTHLLPPLRLMSQDRNSTYVDDYFSIIRNPSSVNDYTPSLVKLTQLEIERLDKELERDIRHKRRQHEAPSGAGRGTSRRALLAARAGPSVPDLSVVPKTFRTPNPTALLPGGIDVCNPDIFAYNEIIVHRTNVANPEFEPPQPKYNRVVYRRDENFNRFIVKIKFGPPPHAQAQQYGYGNLYPYMQRGTM